ncbi:hypothetical protein FBQ96_03005 [Nitrospirales bacterium NOB]|nr:MAG: hypothetical protein UZ03_NOB001001872 [Nitrospira sp. OLB3]MDL1888546.1 hypothetical protein [Nitrospirales bacterium NOB]
MQHPSNRLHVKILTACPCFCVCCRRIKGPAIRTYHVTTASRETYCFDCYEAAADLGSFDGFNHPGKEAA